MENYKKFPHVPLVIATRRQISTVFLHKQLIFPENVTSGQCGVRHPWLELSWETCFLTLCHTQMQVHSLKGWHFKWVVFLFETGHRSTSKAGPKQSILLTYFIQKKRLAERGERNEIRRDRKTTTWVIMCVNPLPNSFYLLPWCFLRRDAQQNRREQKASKRGF